MSLQKMDSPQVGPSSGHGYSQQNNGGSSSSFGHLRNHQPAGGPSPSTLSENPYHNTGGGGGPSHFNLDANQYLTREDAVMSSAREVSQFDLESGKAKAMGAMAQKPAWAKSERARPPQMAPEVWSQGRRVKMQPCAQVMCRMRPGNHRQIRHVGRECRQINENENLMKMARK